MLLCLFRHVDQLRPPPPPSSRSSTAFTGRLAAVDQALGNERRWTSASSTTDTVPVHSPLAARSLSQGLSRRRSRGLAFGFNGVEKRRRDQGPPSARHQDPAAEVPQLDGVRHCPMLQTSGRGDRVPPGMSSGPDERRRRSLKVAPLQSRTMSCCLCLLASLLGCSPVTPIGEQLVDGGGTGNEICAPVRKRKLLRSITSDQTMSARPQNHSRTIGTPHCGSSKKDRARTLKCATGARRDCA